MQANLVTVNSDHEMKFLMDLLGDWGGWCGLNNLDNLQQFEWVSGENSGYTNWGRNQPQVNKKKQCVRIQRTQNYKWITNKCNNKLRYTCEKGVYGQKIAKSVTNMIIIRIQVIFTTGLLYEPPDHTLTCPASAKISGKIQIQ